MDVTELDSLPKALFYAQSQALPVGKDGQVVGKFSYASHNHVARIARKAFHEAGLLFTTSDLDITEGGAARLKWTLEHPPTGASREGTYVCPDWHMRNMGTAQALGSTKSYLTKYVLIGLLMLDVGDDAVEHYDRAKAEAEADEEAERKRVEAEARKEWQMLRGKLNELLSAHLEGCEVEATPDAKRAALAELMDSWPDRPTADDYRAAIHSVQAAEAERRGQS